MAESRPILRVGLTGGIASGKTTVARLLSELGALVVDADALAQQALAPGQPAHTKVVERFGRAILDDQGQIQRARLAQEIFSDARAREALNAIVHPEVRAEAERRFAALAPRDRPAIAILDAALLVETGAYRDFDKLIVLRCAVEAQLRRIRERDGLSAEDARARVAAQAPLSHKLALADYIIDTDGTLEETRRQTERVYVGLEGDYLRRFPCKPT